MVSEEDDDIFICKRFAGQAVGLFDKGGATRVILPAVVGTVIQVLAPKDLIFIGVEDPEGMGGLSFRRLHIKMHIGKIERI
jgi:hypothetical protein